MSVSVTFHGHATLTIVVNDTTLLVDPFFGGNPQAKISADDVNPDYILITHGHADHIADAVGIAKRTGATCIANAEIADWLAGQGVEKVHGQHLGGGYQHPFGHLKFTVAHHGSGLPDGSYGGNPAGFLLTVDDKRIYISGDTGLFSDMALIGRQDLDLAILCVGDNYTMGPEDSLIALDFLKPATVIPYHYNTWPPISIDVDAWKEGVLAETTAKPVMLAAEESFTLE